MVYKRKEITNHREIERIVEIHEVIAAGNYPTTEKLAKRFECSTATISRDIDFLRNRCEAPLEYDSSKRGYYYTEPNFQLKFDIQKNPMDAIVADGKRSFSEYVNIPMSVLDRAEEITNLNLPEQTEFTANLSCKYIGRTYFADECTWLGLKVFDYIDAPLLTIAHFESDQSNPKEISLMLQNTKLNYISEYSACDNGYWHYIIVDQKLFDTNVEVARMELINLISFIRGGEC
jgi:hypothetical protein